MCTNVLLFPFSKIDKKIISMNNEVNLLNCNWIEIVVSIRLSITLIEIDISADNSKWIKPTNSEQLPPYHIFLILAIISLIQNKKIPLSIVL